MSGSVIVAGARTPIGKLAGGLAGFSGSDLGGFAIREALARAGVAPESVDYVLMGQVLLAAMRDPDMQEELGVVPPALFQALGWPLQPAFYLNVPVIVERDVTPVPLVREHLIDLRPWPAARISARVVGPDNRPLPGVQVSQGGTSITTDEGGLFSLPVMHPTAPLSVRWKSVVHEVSAVPATDGEDSPEQLAAQQDVQIRLPEPS